MNIQEKDFKIIKEGKCLVLYVLKNKKDFKEGEEAFKIAGYYTFLLSALKGALKFRLDKKYPGKESALELALEIKRYKKSRFLLDSSVNQIYNPIFELKAKTIKYE